MQTGVGEGVTVGVFGSMVAGVIAIGLGVCDGRSLLMVGVTDGVEVLDGTGEIVAVPVLVGVWVRVGVFVRVGVRVGVALLMLSQVSTLFAALYQ